MSCRCAAKGGPARCKNTCEHGPRNDARALGAQVLAGKATKVAASRLVLRAGFPPKPIAIGDDAKTTKVRPPPPFPCASHNAVGRPAKAVTVTAL